MEDRKPICTDEEIEDMLSPKYEFRPSPGIMENVLAEAERISSSARKRKKKLWFVRSCAAAAVVAIVSVTATVLNDREGKNINKVQTQVKTAMVVDNKVSTVKPAIDTEAPALRHNKGESFIEKNNNISQRQAKAIRNTMRNVTEDNSDKEKNIDVETTEEINHHVSETSIEPTEQLMAATNELDDYYGSSRRPYIVKVRYESTESDSETKEIREYNYLCESI